MLILKFKFTGNTDNKNSVSEILYEVNTVSSNTADKRLDWK